MFMFLGVVVIDIIIRTLIFMYCYNILVPKLNLQLPEKINFTESLLVIILVHVLIGH